MAPDYEAVSVADKQYVADVKQAMPIDKAVLFGSYSKGTATEWSDVDICFFSDTFAHENSVEIISDLLGLARRYHPDICFDPRVFLTSDIENDNPFVREVLRTGREIEQHTDLNLSPVTGIMMPGGVFMAEQKHSGNLYNDFLHYDYQELESFVSKAKDKIEREFYARLCDFYLAKNQPRVMREKPF